MCARARVCESERERVCLGCSVNRRQIGGGRTKSNTQSLPHFLYQGHYSQSSSFVVAQKNRLVALSLPMHDLS